MPLRTSHGDKGARVERQSLIEDTCLPAAAVFDDPLARNIAWMQHFADCRGCRLAPHGKTTMTPAVFRRQLAAGAWGMTLATAAQCDAAFAHGVNRILWPTSWSRAQHGHHFGSARAGPGLCRRG